MQLQELQLRLLKRINAMKKIFLICLCLFSLGSFCFADSKPGRLPIYNGRKANNSDATTINTQNVWEQVVGFQAGGAGCATHSYENSSIIVEHASSFKIRNTTNTDNVTIKHGNVKLSRL